MKLLLQISPIQPLIQDKQFMRYVYNIAQMNIQINFKPNLHLHNL